MRLTIVLMAALSALAGRPPEADAAELSDASQACVICHETIHTGIVADWQHGRHSTTSPAEALEQVEILRRISTEDFPAELLSTAVGCAECHTMRPDEHPDTFDHQGFRVHTIVTPEDCAVCHPVERQQYSRNLMAHARGNLHSNPVYHGLVNAVTGPITVEGIDLIQGATDEMTENDACFFCHGSEVRFEGLQTRETAMGELELPKFSGWPNQGVGRVNPDGSMGTCSACHTRHQFSIAVARQPQTCSTCHKGPDVPAYKVYEVSKHGNMYAAQKKDWDFDAVPWVLGDSITAPTCATCHASLLVNGDFEAMAERTHAFSDRLPYRLMGLPYSAPHPKEADTTIIRNAAGLPLPTELTGEPAMEFLIDADEQSARLSNMQKTCLACHSTGWVDGHFEKLHHTIAETNQATLSATQLLLAAWENGLAKGLADGDSVFNEEIERMWVEQWLFYANSTRFASAMAGADYGVFAEGRWYLSQNLAAMHEWLKLRLPED